MVRNEPGRSDTDLIKYLLAILKNECFFLNPEVKGEILFLKDHPSSRAEWLWVRKYGLLPGIRRSGKEMITIILMGK